ncbi:MAG TPA: sigma 54-interacting transcriptional regulator [Polyangiales bacterium]|nr:sigma 54-interacting transcriptional regulator [Polyangiales bacterium]
MTEKPRLLVIDDGTSYARIVREHVPEVRLLTPPGSEEGRFSDGKSALRYLDKHASTVDLVLLDVSFDLDEPLLLPLAEGSSLKRSKRYQGVAILRAIRARWPELPVVLLTAERDLSLADVGAELATQSMTYFLDGDDLDALRIRIHSALLAARQDAEDGAVLWGRDPQMSALRRRLMVLARGAMPVILEGETGTGKSYLAERFVHRHSGRKGPFVVLDLSTVPRDLVAAQLFGAVRGAYTGSLQDRKGVFEEAHRGTLFLDEIQNASLEVQKQLLLVLQDRRLRPVGGTRETSVDVKVVVASNGSLAQAVAEQRFRADLYMRLSPATRVTIPPLRARPGDLRFFTERFVERALEDAELSQLRDRLAQAQSLPKGAPLHLLVEREPAADSGKDHLELMLPSTAWDRLRKHGWPGNLRELAMVVHNFVAFTLVAACDALESGVALRSPRLQVDTGLVGQLLADSGHSEPQPVSHGEPGEPGNDRGQRIAVRAGDSLNAVAQDVERQYLLGLFRDTAGDFSRMAHLLLGDASRARAVRLRFNQLGLKIRELRQA